MFQDLNMLLEMSYQKRLAGQLKASMRNHFVSANHPDECWELR